ncbi:MAG: hypothetical protein Kow0068_08220 [Marinilabiliales bacterium]
MCQGDWIYMFTDGYADQFGGKDGKKLKYKQFKNFILNNSNLSGKDQKDRLDKIFIEWQGINEQIDDVLVLGFKI